MNTIRPTRIYKKKISEYAKIVVDLSAPFNHSNVISPIEVSYDSNATYLHYSVSVKGMTLRDFIKPKQRITLLNTLYRNDPIHIILQLIDAFDFMTRNNMLVGQPIINPDCIWIERDTSGEIKAFVMNTLNRYSRPFMDDHNQQYWSSDYVNEYHNVNYYNKEKPMLTRCDTNLSSNHIVYSLGLLLYFIVVHNDPYPEGRVNPTDRPYFTTNFNTKYKTYIILATEPNIVTRISLMEWKSLLEKNGAKKGWCFIM